MSLKTLRPIFIENSSIPNILSFFSPISIGAITLGPLVFSRGEMSDRTKNHESIHWQQYIETCIIGFPILYFIYWLIGLLKYRDGGISYIFIPFEQEAYENEDNQLYLLQRKRFNWIKRKI